MSYALIIRNTSGILLRVEKHYDTLDAATQGQQLWVASGVRAEIRCVADKATSVATQATAEIIDWR